MNLQESIKRILREEGVKSNFFLRRIRFDDVKNRLSTNVEMVYHSTETYKEFKYLLTLTAVEEIMWNDHKIHWEDLPQKEEIEFVTELSNMFEKTIRRLYNIYQNK